MALYKVRTNLGGFNIVSVTDGIAYGFLGGGDSGGRKGRWWKGNMILFGMFNSKYNNANVY